MSDTQIILCTAENFHPEECGGPPCRHCTRAKVGDHDPRHCCFCVEDRWRGRPRWLHWFRWMAEAMYGWVWINRKTS